jgi:hypothetical protein
MERLDVLVSDNPTFEAEGDGCGGPGQNTGAAGGDVEEQEGAYRPFDFLRPATGGVGVGAHQLERTTLLCV